MPKIKINHNSTVIMRRVIYRWLGEKEDDENYIMRNFTIWSLAMILREQYQNLDGLLE
jgi:hypothetical protein